MSGPPTGKINGLLTAGTLYESKLTGPLAGKTIDILVNMIRSGDAYVNVHTTTNQNGEVRGQISSLESLDDSKSIMTTLY